ncbi:MAG: diguanylate cyclase [Sulfuricurvum sp.]|nr:diguanylate cyclase [Sulfuricurvum sp.]
MHVTVSVGVTTHRIGDNYDDFMGRADKALYQAKNEGKNKTILAD